MEEKSEMCQQVVARFSALFSRAEEIPSLTVSSFFKSQIDEAALESVRELAAQLTDSELSEACRCVERWRAVPPDQLPVRLGVECLLF